MLLVLFFFCPGAGLIILDELILRNSRDYLGLRQFTDEVTLSTTFQPGFFRPWNGLFVFWLVESSIIYKTYRLNYRTVIVSYFIND